MRFTDLFIKRPILSVTLSILILLTGLASLLSLPMRQYPAMESATIVVSTSFPGASQEVMQGFITRRLPRLLPRPAALNISRPLQPLGIAKSWRSWCSTRIRIER